MAKRWRSIRELRADFKASGIDLGQPTPKGPGTQGCTGKVRHVSLIAASEAIARLRRDGKERKHYELQPYRCRFCGFWHVGNRRVDRDGTH
jgi:hypothetical protein